MAAEAPWCTIESDPGVFTALCEAIGVKGVQFEEIYSLDADACAHLEPEKVFGLVFLFKWKREEEREDPRPTVDAMEHGLFFAKQVIRNACATQAILSVLLNTPPEKLDLGEHLSEFKEFCSVLDAETKGLAISNSDRIRLAHNSFKAQSSFEIVKGERESKRRDAFHFVGYVYNEGRIYELDGCKSGPILVGDAPAAAWLGRACEEVKRRIDSFAEKASAGDTSQESPAVELRFNLMAIVADRQLEARRKIERERFLRQRANISLVSHGEDIELSDEVDDDAAPDDIPSFDELSQKEVPELQAIASQCTSTIAELQVVVDSEQQTRDRWAKENARRRHDMVPLALCAMRHLARKRELLPAFEKGKAATMKRAEEKKAAEEAKTTAA